MENLKTNEYTHNCTGNACVGDDVMFQRAVFTGSFRNAKFSHDETILGKIIKDSYGATAQQHTFTIETAAGVIRIKGRNLYKNGTHRKKWDDETLRLTVLNEKHVRGTVARSIRAERKSEALY